jgi:hypothetical protein
MQRFLTAMLLAVAPSLIAAAAAGAQLPRTRSPSGPDGAPASSGIPRDPRFPYAGLWAGTRTMPVGSDEIRLRFSVNDGKYSGETIHPGGARSPENNLVATAAGLSWEQPNSGGGTWVFNVRLVGPDSMTGTLVLRDAPAQFTTVPRGTMVLTRQAAGARQNK